MTTWIIKECLKWKEVWFVINFFLSVMDFIVREQSEMKKLKLPVAFKEATVN